MAYRIAITDDDELSRSNARHILENNGYETVCYSSGEELLAAIDNGVLPDLIFLDIHMEGINGIQTMRKLKEREKETGNSFPVIILTADIDATNETEAFANGAMDYVEKPFVPAILLLRARNTISLFNLQKDLKAEVAAKTEEVVKEHERNERLSLEVVKTLAGTIDAKDKYTIGHSSRVASYAREIARRAGYSKREQNDIYMMGLLHDIGKIGIGGKIINKPSGLTDEEYGIMKTHPMKGYDILKNITEMPKLAVGARYHHERYDGKGYPDGLKGSEIPEEARIISVADAYDAMASHRSYHDVKDQEFVKNELIKGRGTQFDPRFADIMIQMITEDTDYKLHEEEMRAPVPEPRRKLAEDPAKKKQRELISGLEQHGYNTEAALVYFMNDIAFYAESLDDFANTYADAQKIVAEMIDFPALDITDVDGYHNFVHSLKSNAKRIGANKVAMLAEQQEFATTKALYDSSNDLEIIAAHNALTESLFEAINIIRKYIKSKKNT